MSDGNRTISAVFLIGAAGLVALVAYALAPGGFPQFGDGDRERVDVVVFLPDLASWDALGRGARRAAESGVVSVEDGAPDRLALRTSGGRRLRLSWHHPAGGWELADRIRSVMKGPVPPSAIVGSSNTALTLTIARTLADLPSSVGEPAFLIPSASAITVPATAGEAISVRLLGLNPGRTFRFCMNNERMADLVIGYVGMVLEEQPKAVFVLVDPLDPFSVDLADCFDRVLERRGIGGERHRTETRADSSFLQGGPTIEEQRLVAPVVDAASDPGEGPIWVLMALQGGATRRLIVALDRALSEDSLKRVRVLSGDGIGLQSLENLATQVGFPVYCVGSGGIVEGEVDDPSDRGRVEAEMIAALAVAVDEADGSEDISEALNELDLRAGVHGTIGRSLRLEEGERVGEDLGLVYELRPEPVALWGHVPGPEGWRSYRKDVATGWQSMTAGSDEP